MNIMATAGRGTYDHTKKQWKVRTKTLKAAMTIAQLSAYFHVELPNDERKTRTYWHRYLEEFANQKTPEQMALEQERDQLLERIGEIKQEIINQTTEWIKEAPAQFQGSVEYEINAFIKSSGYKTQYKTNLAKFQAVVGNIPVTMIDINIYRTWLDSVVANHEGVTQTSVNKIKNVKAFLRHIESLYNLNFAFLGNRKLHKLELPNTVERDLTEEYWTAEEIQKCLACNDFPKAKFALLMGLNCGCYVGDIDSSYFSPDKIKGNLYTSGRAKLVWQGEQKGRIQTYTLWPETLQAVTMATFHQITLDFKKMKKALGITKQQKALRKTGAQHIYEIYAESDEALSRLYRNEGEADTHFTSYTTNKAEKIVDRLAEATDLIRENLIVGKPISSENIS